MPKPPRKLWFILLVLFLLSFFSMFVHNLNLDHPTFQVLSISKSDASDTITLKSRPVSLSAGEEKTTKDQLFFYPQSGYITEISSKLIGSENKEVLHHAVLAHVLGGKDLICPEYKKIIFATGSEMSPFIAPSGYGYQLQALNGLLYLEIHWQNNSQENYDNVHFEYTIKISKKQTKKLYPQWLDVYPVCDRHSSFAIEPKTTQTFSTKKPFVSPYDGKIILAGGHIHKFAKSLNIIKNGEKVIEFLPNFGENGEVLFMSPVYPQELSINRGDKIDLESTYSNPLESPIDAMAIAFIYIAED